MYDPLFLSLIIQQNKTILIKTKLRCKKILFKLSKSSVYFQLWLRLSFKSAL